MSKLVQEKDEVKALIRGILTSSKEIMTSKALFYDFKNMSGFEVPYRKFGFPNFEAYLRSIPDTVLLQASGGPSYNVILVSSEKSKHIDELVQKQKICTKKKGPRKPIRYHSVTMASCSSKPFIPQALQKRISDYLAEYPMGVELQKLENHIKLFKLEQYGGFESLMRQLTHIVKEERGKAYPVNCEASNKNVPSSNINSSLASSVLPSGYEDDNSVLEFDYWDNDYSCSSDEHTVTKTKLMNDQVTKPAGNEAYKQPTANSYADPALKQPTANNFSQSAFKQSTVNNFSEPAYRPHIANNFEPAHKQSTADSFSKSAFIQSTVSNFSEPAYRPHIASNFGSAHIQSTADSCSKSTFEQLKVNNFSEPAYTPHTANNFSSHEPDFRQPLTNNFTEPTFKQQTRNNFSEPANRQPNVKHFSDPAAFSTFMPHSSIEIPKMRETMSSSHISEKMKTNLRRLAEIYPDGIWCSQLPKLYQKHFGVDLNVQNLGFVSVVQFVADIPEVFQSIQTTEADWMVFDARKSIPDHLKDCKEKIRRNPIPEHVLRNLKKLTLKFETGIALDTLKQEYLTTFGKPLDFSEWGFDSLKSFLTSLQDSVLVMECFGNQTIIYPKHGVEKELAKSPVIFSDMEDFLMEHYPPNVIGPKFIIPQQDLPSELKFCSNIEVLIAEVFTPSKFWLQLRGRNTSFALDKLMTDMQEFYNSEYNNELYKMREPTYRELQYCVAPYSDEYHRALITRVFADEVQVKFIDYGTIDIVKKRNLRYLHSDFASLPAQAIRARLCNVQPVEGPNANWPVNACKRFLELVSEKPLIATVHIIDYQTKVLEVALVDTTGEDDVHINDILKAEGYADFWKKKTKNSPVQKQMPKENRQVVSNSRENLKSSNSTTESLVKKFDTDNQNANKSTCTSSSTSDQTKSDDEAPIIISAERRRVLPPPGFNNQTGQQLPSLDSLALINMALYQQALQQQQQQQMLQNLMMTRPEFFMQGSSAFVSPYATTNSFPVIAFPITPVVMPNIAQVPAGNATVINAAMPNITQVPAANNAMINTVMPNIPQVPAATNTRTNIIEVPANRNTVDSATMTTEEEVTISELTENLDISVENKDVTKWTVETNTRFQNNISDEEEDLDEDFIFISDSEGEETDNSNELKACSHQESNVMENKQVVTNNYENMNVRQPQSAPQQHREAIIGPASEISQRYSTVQTQNSVEVKVVEIAQKQVHVINLKGKPHMCTDELVHMFTNFSGRHVVLKILQSKKVEIPFKEIKKAENPKLFQILQFYEIQGVQKPIGIIQQELHMIPLSNVNQFLELLNIKDPKILSGVHATLQSWGTN